MDPSRNRQVLTPLIFSLHISIKMDPTRNTPLLKPRLFSLHISIKMDPPRNIPLSRPLIFLKISPFVFPCKWTPDQGTPFFQGGQFYSIFRAVNLTKRHSTRHERMWCFFSHTHGLFVTCVSPQLALLQRVVTPKQKHSVQPSGSFLSRLKYPGRHWSHSWPPTFTCTHIKTRSPVSDCTL